MAAVLQNGGGSKDVIGRGATIQKREKILDINSSLLDS
jgi:hypothetical protein